MYRRCKAVSGLDDSTAELSSDVTAFRNQDVLDMLSGLPRRIVAEPIKQSRSSFDTSPQALKKLNSEGVPEDSGYVPRAKKETRLS
jgi:hypothetical protein